MCLPVAEISKELADKLNNDLERVRDIRIDLLPEQGSLIEVIADAMNALQVAYVMLATQATRTPPQVPEFQPVSEMLKRDAP